MIQKKTWIIDQDEDSDEEQDQDKIESESESENELSYSNFRKKSKRSKMTEARNAMKHQLKAPCNNKCRKRCWEKFTEERRETIWHGYWELSYNDQRKFCFNKIRREPKLVLTVRHESRRNYSYWYTLVNQAGLVNRSMLHLFSWYLRVQSKKRWCNCCNDEKHTYRCHYLLLLLINVESMIHTTSLQM